MLTLSFLTVRKTGLLSMIVLHEKYSVPRAHLRRSRFCRCASPHGRGEGLRRISMKSFCISTSGADLFFSWSVDVAFLPLEHFAACLHVINRFSEVCRAPFLAHYRRSFYGAASPPPQRVLRFVMSVPYRNG